MLNPIDMYSKIKNNILDRIPQGDAFRARAPQSVDENPGETAQTGTNVPHPPVINTDATFGELIRQFEDATKRAGLPAIDLQSEQINREILAAAQRYELDPELIRALIRAESNFRPDVVSSAGAMGLMQLMPGTAASLGVTDPFDIAQNIDGGSQYLRRMLDLFDGDTSLALAAYNAGAGAVQRHGGIPPFRETQNFVPRVQSYWERNLLDLYKDSTKFG
ncbi:MAG: lytic transglycosylase domain-containing protein [Defluviitaleaceae bacterium]|nr:lytic transglycosylase domain-containing protein [Defluviitaleaceae bacterium]